MNIPAAIAAALAVVLSIVVPNVAIAAGGEVPSGSCNITSGGIGSGNNTTNCNFGLTPDQFKQLTDSVVKGAAEAMGTGATEAAVEAAKKTQQEQIDKISKTLGVTEDAVRSLLKIVGEDPNVPEDKLADAVGKAANDYQRLQAQVAALNPDNPAAKAFVEQAKSEIEAGHFGHAHELLRQATEAQIAAAQEARKLRERAQVGEDGQMLGAASSTAAEGSIVMTESHYTEAAELFAKAADYLPAGHASEHGGYLTQEAQALYHQGDERGDNDALRSCIEIYRHALADYPRLQVALSWAATEMGLGSALSRLGERESGKARLEEGAAAFRAALEEYSRDPRPLNRAMAQMGLGTVLSRLGERESGTARLKEAIVALQAALTDIPRAQYPSEWAQTQNNLGNTLVMLGERESGTARLEEGAAAFRAVLEEQTPERAPLQWGQTQNNLGGVLVRLGERESGTAQLKQAVTALREALKERTRERVPLEWAETQANLGNALRVLGEREGDTAHLEEAVAVYGRALEILTRERVPLEWAASFDNQGVSMVPIADRTNNGALAEVGVKQIATAYEVLRSGGQGPWAAMVQEHLSKARAIRDRLTGK
ncbi:MAG TPA: tetratricopeptide repeat protein [Roseiarcus sp.]|jgi:tetratricopeptide (TPR) repeat protein|nr:tetratricopeptide repeat protein [Roseiarcus sp.]